MVDQSATSWIPQIIAGVTVIIGLIGVVLQRHDVAMRRVDDVEASTIHSIQQVKDEAIRRADAVEVRTLSASSEVEARTSQAIQKATREAADALMAHSQRTDSRIEQGRRELDEHVRQINGRIDRIADDMVRKEDFQAMITQLAALTVRIDRVLEARTKT